MIITIILILLGFVLLIKGADLLVDGSSEIAKKFGIPEIIIGLTIVSIGTSLPELVVSSTSALKGSSDMAIGTIIGSNISNLLLILGISTVIKPIVFPEETKFFEIPLCLIITLLFAIMCNTGLILSRLEAIILLVLFVLFILYIIIMAIKENELTISKRSAKKIKLFKNIAYIAIGIVGLKIGGDLAVKNAAKIAESLGASEKLISLTILALGTSLSELVISIESIIKGNSEIAMGNIIGSNLLNILLIIGVSGIISPLSYNSTYNIQIIILIITTFILSLFPYIKPKDEMNRGNGVFFLTIYVLYLFLLIF